MSGGKDMDTATIIGSARLSAQELRERMQPGSSLRLNEVAELVAADAMIAGTGNGRLFEVRLARLEMSEDPSVARAGLQSVRDLLDRNGSAPVLAVAGMSDAGIVWGVVRVGNITLNSYLIENGYARGDRGTGTIDSEWTPRDLELLARRDRKGMWANAVAGEADIDRLSASELSRRARPGRTLNVVEVPEVMSAFEMTVRIRGQGTFPFALMGVTATGNPVIDAGAKSWTERMVAGGIESGNLQVKVIRISESGTVVGLLALKDVISHNYSILAKGYAKTSGTGDALDNYVPPSIVERQARRDGQGVWDRTAQKLARQRAAAPSRPRPATPAQPKPVSAKPPAGPHWKHSPMPGHSIWEETRSHLHAIVMLAAAGMMVWAVFSVPSQMRDVATATLQSAGMSDTMAAAAVWLAFYGGLSLLIPAIVYAGQSFLEITTQELRYLPLGIHRMLGAWATGASALSVIALSLMVAVTASHPLPGSWSFLSKLAPEPLRQMGARGWAISQEAATTTVVPSTWTLLGLVGVYCSVVAVLAMSATMIRMDAMQGRPHRLGWRAAAILGAPVTVTVGLVRMFAPRWLFALTLGSALVLIILAIRFLW